MSDCRATFTLPLLRSSLLIAAATLPLVLLTGCGKDNDEKAAANMIEQAAKEQGHDMKVDIDNGKTTIKTTDDKGQAVTFEASEAGSTMTSADGNVTMNTGDSAKIPENYPGDAVQYPNLTLTMAMSQDKSVLLNGTTNDATDVVSRELMQQAKSNGWEAQSTFQQGAMSMQSYSKGERSMSVTITAEGEQTMVNIVVSEE